MNEDSIKLARLWVELKNMKDKIDNEIVPVVGYLRADDEDLENSLSDLSRKIQNHFDKFVLSANSVEKAE